MTSTLVNQLSTQYHLVANLNPANSIEFDELTFPSIKKHWHKFQQRGPLYGIAASENGRKVGLIIP